MTTPKAPVDAPHPPEVASKEWRLLVESVADYAIFMLDPAGRVVTWNRGAQAIKGYAALEIIGRHFSQFYSQADLDDRKPERELEAAREHGRVEDEGWRLRKDGSPFWANVVITALRDDSGTLVGFAKVTRDLTERRRAEEELRRSEERFRLLIDGVKDYALYMLDPEGRVSTWNSGAERMKGYAPEEIIGRSFEAFFSAEDRQSGRPVRELAEARDQGRFEEEGWRIRKDGTRFWANVVLTPIRDARGELVGYAKMTRDLTARRAAEETAHSLVREQAAREAAEEANRLKDEFLATVSHELRTPLNAVLGWASLLLDRGGDASTAKGLEAIHRNARAQARIIDDILDVSRIITGKLRVDAKPTDLTRICLEAIEVVRPSAMAKGISIGFGDAAPAVVLGDPERLRQVAWNVLSNAIKFTERGGSVAVHVERSADEVVLVVRDTGRGIEPELLPHVFDRFRQGDSSSTRRFGGLGLGLAIVRHIVELHGGHASAESEGPGKGAVFRIAFPRDPLTEPEEEGRAGAAVRAVAESALDALRVLVVDDDEDARDLIFTLLAGAGAVVETAASASAAFDAVGRFRPDVIVSDIGMPEEDGHSLLRRLVALAEPGRAIPAIALTAYTRAEDRKKALAAGFTAHLGKPVAPDDLVAAVAKLGARPARRDVDWGK
jgi:PAS domain S-box-containing protein